MFYSNTWPNLLLYEIRPSKSASVLGNASEHDYAIGTCSASNGGGSGSGCSGDGVCIAFPWPSNLLNYFIYWIKSCRPLSFVCMWLRHSCQQIVIALSVILFSFQMNLNYYNRAPSQLTNNQLCPKGEQWTHSIWGIAAMLVEYHQIPCPASDLGINADMKSHAVRRPL